MELEEIAFKATIITYDPFKIQPIKDEKFYRVVLPHDSSKRQWIYYHIEHIDTQLRHVSIYIPEQHKIMITSASDTFRELYRLNTWDSTYSCLQNPVSHSAFALSFPFTDCFFTSNRHSRLKSLNGSWVLNDIHPHTGFRRTIWVSQFSGLIDSLYEFRRKELVNRIVFQYYFTKGKTGIRQFLPLPDFYPISLSNPSLMQTLHTQIQVNTPKRYDSSGIRKFLDQRRKLMLLDFWFIGCRPCHQAFPVLEKLRKLYSEDSLDIIALSPFDKQLEIFQFKFKNRFHFDMQYDSLHLNLFYQVHAYPCTILVNEHGEVLYRHEGLNGKLEEELRMVLNQSMKQ